MNLDHLLVSNPRRVRRFFWNIVRPTTLSLVLLSACTQAPQPPSQADAGGSNQAAQEAADANDAQPGAETSAQPTIRRAARALSQKRLFEPVGDNALELYLQVIDEAESLAGTENGAAEEGRLRRLSDSVGADPRSLAQQTLSDLFPYGLLWVKRAVEEQRFTDADRVIGLLERTQPGSESVRTLRDALALAKAQREAALESARTAATQDRPSPAVVQPSTNSVPAAAAPAEPRVAAATSASEASPVATEPAPDPGTATAVVDTPDDPPIEPVSKTLPATTSAAVAVDLVLERQVTPRYPNRARRQRIEGWVEVSFMVQADGSVADPKVVDAEPRGVFDREALEAVRRWKYAPPGRNTDTSRRIEFRLSS